MSRGYWLGVLHAHLPFIKHPEYDYFLEERWLFEAISECYIPLFMRFEELLDEGVVDFRLTVSVTPTLSEMLEDDMLMKRFGHYLDKQIELARNEVERTRKDISFRSVAKFYLERYESIRDYFFDVLCERPLNGFRKFRESGNLEILTSAATHGFLPLLSPNKKAVEAQIKVGVETYKKHFGFPPRGIWLPECAYYEGLDEILSDEGISFFFLDTHGLIYSKPPPRYGVYAPVYTPSGVAVFGRDVESSKQVWSSKEGYPGDCDYRDFYRDIGYDLPFDYIKPYISPDGMRVFTGFKYYRVTGDTDRKEVYDRERAIAKVMEHAANFHFNREKQLEFLSQHMDRVPVVVSPYDAELFGHWWFEGVDFLYYVFREMHRHGVIRPVTASEYLEKYPENQVCKPNPSSWGDRGYYDVWLNGVNDWIYKHLNYMADGMVKEAEKHREERDIVKIRLLNQMMRELLLAQASDWAFLMSTQTAVEYSIRRTKEHIFNFNRLLNMLRTGDIDHGFLDTIERRDSIFPHIDFCVYSC